MSRTDELAHQMADAAIKAAQHYHLGEYEAGDHWASVVQRASDELERIGRPERAVVRECGVS